jgi:hypothetical protein
LTRKPGSKVRERKTRDETYIPQPQTTVTKDATRRREVEKGKREVWAEITKGTLKANKMCTWSYSHHHRTYHQPLQATGLRLRIARDWETTSFPPITT